MSMVEWLDINLMGDDEKTLQSMLNSILKELPSTITPYSTSCVVHAQVAWGHALEYPELLKRFKYYPRRLYIKAKLHGMHTTKTSLTLFERTLSKFYSFYGESDEECIRIQHLIACAQFDLHKYEYVKYLWQFIHKTAADELQRAALPSVGECHPLTLGILNNLAVAEGRLGNYSEQMTILDKVIAFSTASPNFGQYHKDTLTSLHNKAVCLADMEKYDEALDIFKSTLELMEKHHPEDRISINATRFWIAFTELPLGNFTEALQTHRNVHAELVKSFGESHTRTLQCARGIGDCLLELGDYMEAMELLKCNMELANENQSARVERILMQHSVARALFKMERYDEAIIQFRIVLDEELCIYGEPHPSVLTTRVYLADALQLAGCTGEALEHYKFVYEIRVKTLESRTDALDCAIGIGECLLGLGKFEEAMEMLKYNLNFADSPDARVQCVHMKYLIVRALFKVKRYDEAISQFRIVLGNVLSISGETHPAGLATEECLADAWQNVGCTDEALDHYKFVYENRVKILGIDHPETIKAHHPELIDKMKK